MEAEVEVKKHNISVREMPMELWREFRSYCIRHRLTVEVEIVQAINEYLVTRLNKETEKDNAA